MTALAFAPATVSLRSQTFLLVANGRMSRSTMLLSTGGLSVADVTAEILPLVKRVADGIAQRAFGRHLRCGACGRHGETDWNRTKRIQGHIDIPLSAHGLLQAEQLTARLGKEKIDAVYSSDLLRAMQTARPFADALWLDVRSDGRLARVLLRRVSGHDSDEKAMRQRSLRGAMSRIFRPIQTTTTRKRA